MQLVVTLLSKSVLLFPRFSPHSSSSRPTRQRGGAAMTASRRVTAISADQTHHPAQQRIPIGISD